MTGDGLGWWLVGESRVVGGGLGGDGVQCLGWSRWCVWCVGGGGLGVLKGFVGWYECRGRRVGFLGGIR